jgi:site-specific DNA-methyltransferase (adenine-specific)
MYSIYDQINNRKVLVYPERKTVVTKQIDTVELTNEQIISTYFPEDIDVKPEIYFDKVEIGEGNFIYHGDNIEVLKTLPDNSVDSFVTDPPYALEFMGKHWDYDLPSVELWKECYRVLKPGGYLLSFGSSRTYHRMAVKVEDAGFEIRDQIMWVYGSGFPKSKNIGVDVDKIQGNEREVVSINPIPETGMKVKYDINKNEWVTKENIFVTKGHSDWEGFGTSLKPAHEPIVMARKPFKGSVVKNVLNWTTGGINIDDCRVGEELITTNGYGTNGFVASENYKPSSHIGRFPANIIFDEEAGRILDKQSGITSQGHWPKSKTTGFGNFGNGKTTYSGVGEKDNFKGGASRFFYCPKPSKKEKDEGLTSESVIIKGRDEGQNKRKVPHKLRDNKRKNIHATIKPVSLMKYLIRLVTPKYGTTVDPFFGSGTTGKSALEEGNYKFIGIEKEKEYFDIAVERCNYENEKSYKVAA